MKWHLSKWTRPFVFGRPPTQGPQQPGLPRVCRGLRGAHLLAPVSLSWNSSVPQTHPSPCFRSFPPRSYPPGSSYAVSLIMLSRALLLPVSAGEIPKPTNLPSSRVKTPGESSECRTRTSGFESASALCRLWDCDHGQLAPLCPGPSSVKIAPASWGCCENGMSQ